jgi:hypothetical protein
MSATQTQKTPKLGKREARAKELAEGLKRWTEDGTPYGFTVEWKKSRTWGRNPQIYFGNNPTLDVSGCGYCKLSTALAQVLRWLYPHGSEEHDKIWRTGGTGERGVIRALDELGWTLKRTALSPNTDSFTLAPKAVKTA